MAWVLFVPQEMSRHISGNRRDARRVPQTAAGVGQEIQFGNAPFPNIDQSVDEENAATWGR
jgi:hypothetical protein